MIYDDTTKQKQAVFCSKPDIYNLTFSESFIQNLMILFFMLSLAHHLVLWNRTSPLHEPPGCFSSSRSASEVNRSKMPVLLGFGLSAVKKVCNLIPFSLNKNLFLPCRNILRSLFSHFLSSSSVSLFSLLIISGRKPLKFSLWLNISDMLKFPFVSHIPAPGSFIFWLSDSRHRCICCWSEMRGKECKKERSKIPKSLVWQTIQKPHIWSGMTSPLSLTCFTIIYI